MISIRKYLITGRVQGVGFRAFVRQAARTLRLQGTVRNLPDGSVECVAVFTGAPESGGPRDFEARLRKGPPHGRVDDVAIEELSPDLARSLPAGFEITH